MSLHFVVLTMLLIASSVAMVTRRLRVPYTVALVITGVVISIIHRHYYPEMDIGLHLTKDLLFLSLLPVLIYEAAFHLELAEFLANWKSILTLAIPGVVVGILLSSALIFAGFSLSLKASNFSTALLISTIVAATDPVGVIALLRATRAPRRLAVLMEGESLLNDGIAVVAFAVVLVALGLNPHQSQISVGWLLRFIGWEIFGAALLGGAIGSFLAWLTSKVDDHLIEITLSTIGAFGSFLIAEKVHSSGVLACLVAGMFAGNFGAKYGMTASTRVAVVSFWEYATFIANSLIFLLIGLDINMWLLLKESLQILIVWVAMLVARAFFVGLTLPFIARLEGGLPKGFGQVITWGGIRGGIAMVLALSIPRNFADRAVAVNCIFGATLMTILIQSTTVQALLRRLRLIKDENDIEIVETLKGKMRALQAARHYLEKQHLIGAVSNQVYEKLKMELDEEAQAIADMKAQVQPIIEQIMNEELTIMRRHLLLVRKENIRQSVLDGVASPHVMRKIIGELDEKLHHLESHASD